MKDVLEVMLSNLNFELTVPCLARCPLMIPLNLIYSCKLISMSLLLFAVTEVI